MSKIAPLRKVNLIIGQNNTGKSNIVNFLHQQYAYFTSMARDPRSTRREACPFKEIDKHISNERVFHKIAFPIQNAELEKYIKLKLQNNSENKQLISFAQNVIKSLHHQDSDHTWFVYQSNSPAGEYSLVLNTEEYANILHPNEWQSLWRSITAQGGGDLKHHWIPETIKALAYIPETSPPIVVIPAIRKIGASGSEANDFSGEGIIERLAKIQNPPLQKQSDKDKFLSINKFVQNVLENETAILEIPYGRDMILVHMDGKTLPLESLGTGVHEVIILGAAATLLENTVICVEEPELHLHPLLQKKLIKYLSEKTNNQYFLTTHSAHLLDSTEAEIFHVTMTDRASHVDAIFSTKQKSSICNDLGYRASDILQANCIIWVEGPSDRIYLNHWIRGRKPDLTEGIHYSIMFYGGRLFSHLTALDEDETTERVDDFVSVRKLNRNTVIMFDSDKSTSHARLSATKSRLKAEFNDGPGFAWITSGREIENYLDMDKVEEAVIQTHPSADKLVRKSQWDNLLEYSKKRTGEIRVANKVKVAQFYTDTNPADYGVLDLGKRVDELLQFILVSNGHN